MAKNFKELQAKLSPTGRKIRFQPKCGKAEVRIAEILAESGKPLGRILTLTAKDKKSAELLGDIYHFWEAMRGRAAIDLSSMGPAGTHLAEQLFITIGDERETAVRKRPKPHPLGPPIRVPPCAVPKEEVTKLEAAIRRSAREEYNSLVEFGCDPLWLVIHLYY